MNIWEQSFDDLRRPYLEEKNDGNLANNYPPYDKVTRGDVIAGATGKDQMGGKKKKMKSEERKLGGGMKPGSGLGGGKLVYPKGQEPKATGAKPVKENKQAHSNWRSDLGFFTEEDCGSGPMKPKKGIKNKVTINPDLKTEQATTGPVMKPGSGLGGGKLVYPKGQEPKATGAKPVKENKQAHYEPEGEEISEREMTSGEMKKEKNLKKKYDNSGMKASMKKQYGAEKGKQVYFATIRKQAMEQFAGNYEGPLYAPHPDIEEAYKEIDREKENKMYRRAGNLARTALSSKGKKKEDAQKKSSNIVSAITRQKEKERFDRIGQSPKHNEAVENELDYYLGEALRPASERMKRTQTAADRKKQEQQREKKSKLEAEADKILAGFSKKGTGTAKTKAASKASTPEANRKLKSGQKKDNLAMKANKAMSEQEDKMRKGTDYRGRDYGGGHDDKPTVKIPLSGVMQGGWMDKEKKKKGTK